VQPADSLVRVVANVGLRRERQCETQVGRPPADDWSIEGPQTIAPRLCAASAATHAVIVEAVLGKAGLPEGRADLVAGLARAEPERNRSSVSTAPESAANGARAASCRCVPTAALWPARREQEEAPTGRVGPARGGSCCVGALQQDRAGGWWQRAGCPQAPACAATLQRVAQAPVRLT
jgi:hypothetical protein